jgi:uncharacterized protein YraI
VSPSSPARALPSTRLVRLLLAVLFVFVLAAPLVATPRTARAAGAYTTDYLNLRAGPSTENYIKLVMSPGSWVELLSDLGRSGFYKVAYRGELGYAHSDYLSFGGPAAIDAGWGNAGSARTTSALNLRAGPGLSYAVALVMPEGAGVQLTGSAESGFLGVIFDGLNGWASNEYLTPGDSGSDPGSGDGGTAYTTSATASPVFATTAPPAGHRSITYRAARPGATVARPPERTSSRLSTRRQLRTGSPATRCWRWLSASRCSTRMPTTRLRAHPACSSSSPARGQAHRGLARTSSIRSPTRRQRPGCGQSADGANGSASAMNVGPGGSPGRGGAMPQSGGRRMRRGRSALHHG